MKRNNQIKNRSHTRNILNKALLSIIGTVLFFSSFAVAEGDDALVMCKNAKTVRTLRIEGLPDSRCRATYTKQGIEQVIGQSQDKSACEGFIVAVRKTLEEAKWNCRDIKDSRLSTLAVDETH